MTQSAHGAHVGPRAPNRRVAIVTTTRADYGILYWLIREVAADPELELLLYVTGSHLSPEFGSTVNQIEADGLPIKRRIPILSEADSPMAATDAAGVATSKFGRALEEDQPDILVLLGDRYEIVSIALASVLHSVPVAHLHGGELSAGALDEYFRHAVTKLASLHFPATDEYRRRVLQLGEQPERIMAVGAPVLDHLHHTELLSRASLQAALGIALDRPTALVTYHPVTTEPGTNLAAVEALAEAILAEDSLQCIFTKANADVEGRAINQLLASLQSKYPGRFTLVDNMGTKLYFSCLRHFDLLVGNSSSGIIEAPAFALPVVNVGPRQDGRTRARNIIDVDTTTAGIREGIRTARSKSFRATLIGMTNPYDMFGDGNIAGRITAAIKSFLSANYPPNKVFVDWEAGARRE